MRTRRIGHGSVVNSANASGAWSFNAPSKHRLRQLSSNGESFDTNCVRQVVICSWLGALPMLN